MTEYQAISARRICLQTATLLCAYTVAWYQLALPRSPALTFVAAGILQGVSTKVRTPLGERSKWNWLLDGVSLGIIAYGTRKLELVQRVKYLTGGALAGMQLLISNAYPHTFFGRVAAIDVEQDGAENEVNVLYDELIALKDQLTPQDLIRACTALFSKASPYDNCFNNSVASKLQGIHREAIERLAGWEKAAAQMHYYELLNEHSVCFPGIVISEEGLSAAEADKRQEWLDTTGFWITQRLAIWELQKEGLERKLNELKALIGSPDCRLTFNQKIDLCDEYIKEALLYIDIEEEVTNDSWCGEACTFKRELIESLNGFEKCQAYMRNAEFYFNAGIRRKDLFNSIFPEIQPALNPIEQRQFEKWMEEKGNAIRAEWEEAL